MGLLTYRLGNGVWGTVDSSFPNDSIHVIVDSTGSTITIDFKDYTKALDFDSNGNLLYEGFAVPGSAKSAAVWKIKKYTVSLINGTYVNTDEQWAGGSNSQTNIWNNRTSFTYS